MYETDIETCKRYSVVNSLFLSFTPGYDIRFKSTEKRVSCTLELSCLCLLPVTIAQMLNSSVTKNTNRFLF